jgi:hypothetical protein
VHNVDHVGLEVEERRAGRVLAARGLVVKHVGAVDLSLPPQYSQSPPMSYSSHTTFQNLVLIWLPHWPACTCAISR